MEYINIPEYVASSDIGIAFYDNTNINNYFCASNKVYDFITLNKQIITNNYPGLRFIEKNRYGVCLDQITPEHIANAILRLPVSNYKAIDNDKYLWENQEEKFLSIYQ